MAYSIWQSNYSYSFGDVVAAVPEEIIDDEGDLIGQRPIQAYGLVFRCITAGTSASGEPSWPSETYKTVTISGVPTASVGYVDDNTVRWAAISAVHADLQAIYPSSIIEMFELELNQRQHESSEVLRFHAGTNLNLNTELVWQGNVYRALPIEAQGFEYAGTGQLPRPTIRVSNLYLVISTALAELPRGLEGAKVTRIRTLARYLDAENFPADAFILQEDGGIFLTEDGSQMATEDGQGNPLGDPDPLAEFPREIFFVDRKSAENRDIVEFELASVFDLQNMRVPRRQTIANICQWKYRSYDATVSGFDMTGVTCPYIGGQYYTVSGASTLDPALDVCNKRLDGCRLRFDPVTLNGFVTSGSTSLSLLIPGQGQAAGSGMPITGFGLQDNTTIVSYIAASGIIQLSAPAIRTSPTTISGTLVNAGLQINLSVANAAKIAPGMFVAGSGIPDDTTVRSVNYATGAIALNLTSNPLAFSTIVSAEGFFYQQDDGTYPYISIPSYAAVSPGDKVFGTGSFNDPYGIVKNFQVYEGTVVTAQDFDVSTGQYIIGLNKAQSFGRPEGTLANFTIGNALTFSLAPYTFSAETTYVARGTNPSLPFGGFPSVGAYKV